MTELREVVTVLNTLTLPGAIAFAALCGLTAWVLGKLFS